MTFLSIREFKASNYQRELIDMKTNCLYCVSVNCNVGTMKTVSSELKIYGKTNLIKITGT